MKELCEYLVKRLIDKGLTLSCAESCTGGLIAKSITDVPGCSQTFYGGVVSYDNSVKIKALNVKDTDLQKFGAVSSTVAEQMAIGVKKLCETDIGISTTGIAGPDGGTKDKPVGTVYVGFAIKSKVESQLLKLPSCLSREEIRQRAAFEILTQLLEKINENY